jgi:hypothetical protein
MIRIRLGYDVLRTALTMNGTLGKDLEKQANEDQQQIEVMDQISREPTGAIAAEDLEKGDSMYARLARMGTKMKVEVRGIERVPEDERTDTSYWNIGSMVHPFLPSLS